MICAPAGVLPDAAAATGGEDRLTASLVHYQDPKFFQPSMQIKYSRAASVTDAVGDGTSDFLSSNQRGLPGLRDRGDPSARQKIQEERRAVHDV
jgi:hypothetical protein